MTFECATPGCTHQGGHGVWRLFCRRCSTRLALIRTAFEAEEPGSSSYGNRITSRRAPDATSAGTPHLAA